MTTPAFQDFSRDFPDVAAWLQSEKFDFAVSLRQQAERKGTLSIGQINAARKCMARAAEKAAAMAEAEARAPMDTGKLEEVFVIAKSNGLKKPGINIGPFRFSPAPETGRNPGAIYVKHEGQYLGKVLNGKFLAQCSTDVLNQVMGIAADPFGRAVEHGQLTGRCAICNRNLKDEDSTGRGIGPVCARKFGML